MKFATVIVAAFASTVLGASAAPKASGAAMQGGDAAGMGDKGAAGLADLKKCAAKCTKEAGTDLGKVQACLMKECKSQVDALGGGGAMSMASAASMAGGAPTPAAGM